MPSELVRLQNLELGMRVMVFAFTTVLSVLTIMTAFPILPDNAQNWIAFSAGTINTILVCPTNIVMEHIRNRIHSLKKMSYIALAPDAVERCAWLRQWVPFKAKWGE